jgi:hypothetical protein
VGTAFEAVRTLHCLISYENNAKRAAALHILPLLRSLKGLYGTHFDIVGSQIIHKIQHMVLLPSPFFASSASSSSAESRILFPSVLLHHFRSDHEACLRRVHGSPLPAGQTAMGDTCNGYGVKLFEDGVLYAGDFEEGLRSGRGVQRWPDGHVYIGQWKRGKREGQGEYRFSHGDSDGSGVIEDNECDIYRGEWLDDMFHGTGAYTFMGGDVYMGQFRMNEQCGAGAFISSDGWPL